MKVTIPCSIAACFTYVYTAVATAAIFPAGDDMLQMDAACIDVSIVTSVTCCKQHATDNTYEANEQSS